MPARWPPRYGELMAEYTTPPPGLGLGDLLTLFAAPISGVTKSVQQFQRGVNEFLAAVENFNATMEQMNQVAARVNRMLDDLEPPVRALMPQLTRTITTMDSVAEQFSALPRDLSQVLDVLGDLSRRLQPLGQLAEQASGLGFLRQLGGILPGVRTAEQPAPAAPTAKKKTTTTTPTATTPTTTTAAKAKPRAKAPAKAKTTATRTTTTTKKTAASR